MENKTLCAKSLFNSDTLSPLLRKAIDLILGCKCEENRKEELQAAVWYLNQEIGKYE